MTLFYAYLKSSVNDTQSRYIIAFVNREASDEWWRLVSTPPSPYAADIQRIAPQFFVQNTNKVDVKDFFNNSNLVDAKTFLSKMFITLLNDRDNRVLSIAPPIKVTDHISGRWYFVRSQDDPHRHWYLCSDDTCLVCGGTDCRIIHVSTERRSRFYIQVRDEGVQPPENFVIISSDQIIITTSDDYILRVTDGGPLEAMKTSQVPTPDTIFLFSDFKNRFVTSATKLGDGAVAEYVKAVDRGSGEIWELSD